MVRFILKKILYGTLVMMGVILVIFLIFLFINADPERLTMGQRSDIESREAVKVRLGLDKPWYSRLGIYLVNLAPVWVHEDTPEMQEEYAYKRLMGAGQVRALVAKWPYLGRSYQTNRKVGPLLLQGLKNTLILSLTALCIAMMLGILLGVLAAVNHGNWIDQLTVTLASIGVSIPSYFSAILLSFLLGYLFRDFTGLNMIGSLYDLRGSLQLRNLILPAIALGIRPVAIITQLTRSSLLDVLKQDYVRTAIAKGLSGRVVLFRHSLRNALNAVITSVSGWFASMLAGAYFVEVIFNFKGLGFITVRAIEHFDFPVIMGAVLLGAVIFVTINVMVDILYGLIDPRVKLST